MSSDFSRLRLLVLLLATTVVLATIGCSDDDEPVVAPPAPPPPAVDLFTGAYVMENWADTGIDDGATSIDPASGSTATAAFGYDVPDGGCFSGRSFRTATFLVPVPSSGVVTFDWVYTGFHAWHQATAFFRVFAGVKEIVEVNEQSVSGNFSFSGSTSINVSGGGTFGFEIGGKNFDTDCTLRGTLTITNSPAP